MSILRKRQFLQQIAAIPGMERGKLSAYSFKERSGVAGPYHKLQHWQDGKNHTRYVPADELPAVEAALAGYAQYQQVKAEDRSVGFGIGLAFSKGIVEAHGSTIEVLSEAGKGSRFYFVLERVDAPAQSAKAA